jgi:GAF domain-containing protein
VGGERAAWVWTEIGRRAGDGRVTVAHACDAAAEGLGADGAGVSIMVSPTARETFHATDRIAQELEEWQLSFGEGPCVDAFNEGGPVLVGDIDLPECRQRWPIFTPAARGSGARALFAFPMQIGAIRLGVLDVYRAVPGPLRGSELADALAYADAIGTLMLEATADEGSKPWWRDDPTVNQAEVHQATGMILAQLSVTAEEAFARLRAYAYSHDRRLGDVARDVVQRRLRFDPDPPLDGRGRHDSDIV